MQVLYGIYCAATTLVEINYLHDHDVSAYAMFGLIVAGLFAQLGIGHALLEGSLTNGECATVGVNAKAG